MILFHLQDVKFHVEHKQKIKQWIKQIAKFQRKQLGDINFVLCSDQYLLEINQQYLNHDDFTDIITFPSEDREGYIGGDIYISIDRVRENALTFQVTTYQELLRVFAHGILHLCGYKDTSKELKAHMSALEDQCLEMFHVEPNQI